MNESVLKIEIKWLSNKENREECISLRKAIFCDEQKFSWDLEIDEYDSENNTHTQNLLIFCDKKAIATARLSLKKDNKWYLSRFCLLKEYRGKKIGNLLIEEFLKKCKEMKIEEVYLSSQLYVKDFYKKHGFNEFGEVYYDEHVEHIMMSKKIF